MDTKSKTQTGSDRTATTTEDEASNQTANLKDHIKVFLEERLTSTRSQEIKEEMAGLGYDERDTVGALHELRREGEVERLKDEEGNPVNKYKRAGGSK